MLGPATGVDLWSIGGKAVASVVVAVDVEGPGKVSLLAADVRLEPSSISSVEWSQSIFGA